MMNNPKSMTKESSMVTPTAAQLAYYQNELSAFCHFGMNTFTDAEWGDGTENTNQFALRDAFDAFNYVKAVKDAGFKRLIFTAKHHDGFCLWPSSFTKHTIAYSPYKNGNGDILAEVSAACTQLNMDMGLYLSPWDRNAKSYGYFDEAGNETTKELDVLDYNEYYINQLKEILYNPNYGNHGVFVELWLDNAKEKGYYAQEYDLQAWYKIFYDKNPDGLIFSIQSGSTISWAGNEAGKTRHNTLWSMTKIKENNELDTNDYMGYQDGDVWTVFECDTTITPGWFWHKNDEPKSMSALGDIYFHTIGHGTTLLLNIPPDNRGKLPDNISDRIKEFWTAIEKSFADNLITNASSDTKASQVLDGQMDTFWTTDGNTTGCMEFNVCTDKEFDCILLEENIAQGQRISAFRVEYKDKQSDDWLELASSTTIGARRLIRLDRYVAAKQLRITILEALLEPQITKVGVYRLASAFSIVQNEMADK